MKFKHYLKFESLGMTELYEICEPIGFVGSKFVREQEAQRYARSYEYFAIDKLKFVNKFNNIKITERTIDSIGTTSEYMDYGFNFIIDSLKLKGQTAKIYYSCSLDGVFFPSFQLELQEEDITDWRTYVECKLVQNDKVAEIKTKFDDKVNIFAIEDYKGNPITPASTVKILRKGLIESKSSKIVLTEQTVVSCQHSSSGESTKKYYFNPAINITKSDLKHTVNNINSYESALVSGLTGGVNPTGSVDEMYYYVAQKETFDLQVKIKNLTWLQEISNWQNNGYIDYKFIITCGYSGTSNEFYNNEILWNQFDDINDDAYTATLNDTFTIPYIPVGAKVYIYFLTNHRNSGYFGGTKDARSTISPYEIEFSADVKALDLVFPAVRYIDFLKQSLKPINALPIVAPLFDIGGKHYNQVVFTKRNITGKIDEFYTTPKTAMESVSEVNCDYEPNNEFVFIGQDEDFYQNVEIASFTAIPDEAITCKFNPKASLKKIVYKYNTYSNDRDVKNSDKVVHAESEWSTNVELAKSNLERTFEQIRDSIQEQDMVDLETKKPTVLTDRDDKFYLRTITELAPSIKADYTFRLLLQANGNIRKVKNYSLAGGEEQDLGLNWLSMGLMVGQVVQVNDEFLTVTAIEQDSTDIDGQIVGGGREITFTAPTSTTFQGDYTLRFQYSYTGVQYVTKSQEGYDTVDGVSETFGNLDYTPKRNMKYFGKLLAMTATKNTDFKISNVQYKNNGNLKTKLTTETEVLTENAPIVKTDLPQPYITDLIYNIKLAVPYVQAVAYFAGYYQNRGFIRCFLQNDEVLKGFPKKIEYDIVSQQMNITELEELFEGVYLTIITNGNDLFVNDVKYSKSGNLNWFEFRNDKLKVYDKKSKPICNWYDYNLVILNGVSYDSKDALYLALKNG